MTPWMVAGMPVGGFCILMGVWISRGFIRLTLAVLPARWGARTDAWWVGAPPRGRITRGVAWATLFLTMIAWLVLPFVRAGSGDGTWLLGAVVAVVSLCAAVSAWSPETPSVAWGVMLLTESACLAAEALTAPPHRVLALAIGGIGIALLLATWRSGLPPLAGEAATLLAVRRWLAGGTLATVGAGVALAFPAHAWLFPLGMAIWCGAVPFNSGMLAAHERGSPATAMLVVGALIPAGTGVLLAGPRLPAPWPGVFMASAAAAWCMSLRQTDLRRAIGYWASAGSCAALACSRDAGAARLMAAGTACGATMATFLCGAVERDRGHREISRLRGLAARWPGGMGWMVLAGLMMTGAPPFASFAARALLGRGGGGGGVWSPLGPLLATQMLGTACLLTMVHRTYLGHPRTEEEPLDLAGRQKLVLGMLTALAVSAAAITS